MKAKFLVPLFLFLLLAVFLGVGLQLNPREVPSPLIDKPAPEFRLSRLDDPTTQLGLDDMKGKVWLLNVWATWCVACRQEHPVLVQLSRSHQVPIIGLNYKEVRGDGMIDMHKLPAEDELPMAVNRANEWLDTHGNPYDVTVLDLEGRVGIDFGVYGVPETFLIDKKGVIRYKQIGPVTPEALKDTILPKVKALEAET
ncbi:DsbE family thiol:disulfide interchange protein [Nitrogeniibacter mangrovi]|uniref:DsbE family thiol:disulfide interchange protein n=1 Tax=Nitrogeniibacter mangrovi TaxID=2016596 RepID=A0A6C1B6R1_9RHOO|nr:DsbE family thiol:disulfide interchange protein [Nitrogeniibacter mangrovi]QID19436.1 DsbE family thiol:disulfide interchange protein [Nitrogeniibacter mangrovi]